ncbi:MAG: hypothetical protein NZZ41_00400 [Candidatus Dojkabacteria bacterium]|nr:hypothetical protein [Candidatus Dojkabacteria bacterium]
MMDFLEKKISAYVYLFYDDSDNFDKKTKNLDYYRILSKKLTPAVLDFISYLENNNDPTEEEIQFNSYEIAKKYLNKDEIRMFFSVLYILSLKQKEGPRFASMVKFMGVDRFLSSLKENLYSN